MGVIISDFLDRTRNQDFHEHCFETPKCSMPVMELTNGAAQDKVEQRLDDQSLTGDAAI